MRIDSIFCLSTVCLSFIIFFPVSSLRVPQLSSKNVRDGISEFLYKCKGKNSTSGRETILKASLCIENGVAQVSGRRLRGNEDIASTCRALSSVLHCLHPLKDDLEKCSGKEEVGMMDLLEEFCKDGGVKLKEFQEAFICVQIERKRFEMCLSKVDENGYLHNLKKSLRNPCEPLSILERCTEETLPLCQAKEPEKFFLRFITELETSNPSAFNCTTRRSLRNVHSSNLAASSFSQIQSYLLLFGMIVSVIKIF